jgi:hypothetical protein
VKSAQFRSGFAPRKGGSIFLRIINDRTAVTRRHQESAREPVTAAARSVTHLGALAIRMLGDSFSFFIPERSAVVRHHSAGLLGLTRVATGRRSREFLDSGYGFLA